jgi:hypothetical protein
MGLSVKSTLCKLKPDNIVLSPIRLFCMPIMNVHKTKIIFIEGFTVFVLCHNCNMTFNMDRVRKQMN